MGFSQVSRDRSKPTCRRAVPVPPGSVLDARFLADHGIAVGRPAASVNNDRSANRFHSSGAEVPCPHFSSSVRSSRPATSRRRSSSLVRGLARGAGQPDAAGRHRLGQDVHDGQRHRPVRQARRWCCRTTRRWRPSSTTSSRSSSRTTPSATSSAITTTTSPKPTSPSATSTSRRTPRSTRRSTGCGWPATSALVSREDVIVVASVSCIYGLGSPDDYRKMMVRLQRRRHRSTATRCC